jgi:SAM-dependent methyltransferase
VGERHVSSVAAAGFGAEAVAYERARPGYPGGAIDLLTAELGIGSGRRVLDLAAGTGKLTRLLVGRGADVVAVEPVAAMRAQLQRTLPDVEVLDGAAEAVPLPDADVDVVTVAQAFHWFDRAAALAEIARVLRPGGGLAMLWNQRDESVPWVAELSEIIHGGRDLPYEDGIDWAGVVAATGCFTPLRVRRRAHEQVLDVDGLVERVRSTSFIAVLGPDEQAEVEQRVRQLVEGFGSPFVLPYVTHVYWCRRGPG